MKGKLLLLVFLLAFAVPSFGGTISLDFGTGNAGAGGVLTVLGGGQASGSNIPIGTLSVAGAPVSGIFPVTGSCANSSGCLAFDTIASTLSIIGTVDGVTGTLLSGEIDSFTLNDYVVVATLYATGLDTKDAELLDALGITYGHPFTYYGFTLAANTTGGGFVPTSTDVLNTTATPEPVSMLLFGTFFSLAGGLLAKKKRA
ncbi:MAG: hypothetical protein ABSF14_23040 [Terriglobia bacterium]|jgi:hypothetical protein